MTVDGIAMRFLRVSTPMSAGIHTSLVSRRKFFPSSASTEESFQLATIQRPSGRNSKPSNFPLPRARTTRSLLPGLIALAIDYFVLQHIFRTPISMAGGLGIVPVLIYLLVPFLILLVGGGKAGQS